MTEHKSTSTTPSSLDKFITVVQNEFALAADQRKLDIANNRFHEDDDPLEFHYLLDLDQHNPMEMHVLNKHQVPIVTLGITRSELTSPLSEPDKSITYYHYFVKIAIRRVIPKLPSLIYNLTLNNTSSIVEDSKQLDEALQRAIDRVQTAHYCDNCSALTFSDNDNECEVCLFSACLNGTVEKCSICQEDTHRYFTLPLCKHSFHYKCLKQIEFQQESTPYGTILQRHCPLCRKTFTLSA